jgi:hypothetical protein
MKSLFGKYPLEEEEKKIDEAFAFSTKASANIILFPFVFNKEETVELFKKAKEKLEEVGA